MTPCSAWGAAQGARALVQRARVVGVGLQLPALQRSRRLLPCLLRLLQQQRQERRARSPHPAAPLPPPPPPPPSPSSLQPPSQCPLHSRPYPPPRPFPPRRGPPAHPCPLWRVGRAAAQPPRSSRPPHCSTMPPRPPFETRVQAPLPPRLPSPLSQPLLPPPLQLPRPVLAALQQRLSAFPSCALPARFSSAPTASHLALKLYPSSSSSSSPPPLSPYPSCSPTPTLRRPPAPPRARTNWGPPFSPPHPFSPPTRALARRQKMPGEVVWACLAAQQHRMPCRGMQGGLPAATPCLQPAGPCCMA